MTKIMHGMAVGMCVVLSGCAALIGPPLMSPQDFAGKWQSAEWGPLELHAAGARVIGTYEHDDGQLDCGVQANILHCRWWELVSAGEPFAKASPKERGEVQFELSEDRQTLRGRWRYDWREDWSAVRDETAPH